VHFSKQYVNFFFISKDALKLIVSNKREVLCHFLFIFDYPKFYNFCNQFNWQSLVKWKLHRDLSLFPVVSVPRTDTHGFSKPCCWWCFAVL